MWKRLRHARPTRGGVVGPTERKARRTDERGTVTLLAVLVLGAIMVSTAFVLDIGLKRVARADMQALVDIVALDLARELDGRTVAELTPVMGAAAEKSLARNPDIVGEGIPDLDIVLGLMDGTGFKPLPAGVPNAVSVNAATEVAYAFGGFTGTNSGATAADAVGESSSTACFKMGSFMAAVVGGDTTVLEPLNKLLGVNLTLTDYQALARADLYLSQLTALSSIGSAERLLTQQLQYVDLVRAMLQALSAETTDNAAAVTALTTISKSTVTATVGGIVLGDVLNVSPSDRAALGIDLSVLDIVGSARLANGTYVVEIPNIQAGVPGVGYQFTGQLQLVSAAEIGCGSPNSPEAMADSGNLSGTLGVEFVNLPSLNVPNLATLQTPKGIGTIVARIGEGSGQLVAPPPVNCGAGTTADPSTFTVNVTTGPASYSLAADLTVAGDVKFSNLEALGLKQALTDLLGNTDGMTKVTIETGAHLIVGTSGQPGGTSSIGLSIPPNDTTPVSVGSTAHISMSSLVSTITSLKINSKVVPVADMGKFLAMTDLIKAELVNSNKDFVAKTMTPLVDNLNTMAIGPIARMVGLRLNGADVFAVDALCGYPRLAG